MEVAFISIWTTTTTAKNKKKKSNEIRMSIIWAIFKKLYSIFTMNPSSFHFIFPSFTFGIFLWISSFLLYDKKNWGSTKPLIKVIRHFTKIYWNITIHSSIQIDFYVCDSELISFEIFLKNVFISKTTMVSCAKFINQNIKKNYKITLV